MYRFFIILEGTPKPFCVFHNELNKTYKFFNLNNDSSEESLPKSIIFLNPTNANSLC